MRPTSGRSALSPTIPKAAVRSPALNWFRPEIVLTAQQAWPQLYLECSNQGVPSHGHARVSQR